MERAPSFHQRQSSAHEDACPLPPPPVAGSENTPRLRACGMTTAWSFMASFTGWQRQEDLKEAILTLQRAFFTNAEKVSW